IAMFRAQAMIVAIVVSLADGVLPKKARMEAGMLYRFKPVNRRTENQPRHLIHQEFLNRLPISSLLSVIINNGSMENGKAKARKTCELFIKSFNAVCSSIALLPLVNMTQISTGITE